METLRDLTGKPLTGKPATKKGRFFLGSGRFWPFCPLRALTGSPLRGRDGPYGKGPLREGWLPSQKRTTKRLTGRLGSHGKPLTRRDGPYGKGRGPVRVLHREGRRRGLRDGRALTGKPLTRRDGPYEKGRSLMEGPGSLTVLHREGRRRGLREGRAITEGPYEERFLHREGRRRGLREGRALTGSPLRGGAVLTGRAGVREAYGKLWGETLPELGGNFRLCAVDQKRPFFLGLGRFWTFYPLRVSLTGALTGTALREGPLRGGFLREGWAYRKPLTRRDGPYGKGRGPVRVLHREGRRRGLREGRALTGKPLTRRDGPYEKSRSLQGPLRADRLTGRRLLTSELQESLREATGRDFTRIGREFPLVCRRPKKAVFS